MSSAAVDRFTKFLVMECEDTGNNEFVDELLDRAKAAILEGQGSVAFLQAASGNGKSVTQAEALTCDEVAYACRMAKRTVENAAGNGPFTFLDFSSSDRPYPLGYFP